jgi:hypothetical protein
MGHGPHGQQGSGLPKPDRVDDAQADRLVRNVYKVLLTRGMRGVAIRSVDQETNDRLRELLSNRLIEAAAAAGITTAIYGDRVPVLTGLTAARV